jgi:glutamate dehydrogenase (NAD(P)+)
MHDEFGPEKIVEVYDAKANMHGFVVIDNTALGPGKGGIRMTPGVTKEEVFRLARAMTWKNALAGLPFGGAKSGIIANPRQFSIEKKEEIVKSFAKALKEVSPSKYIAAPDISMGEKEVKWFVEANGDMKSATGKPSALGGLPHELGSTGFGVYHATVVGAKYANLDLKNSTFAVEGFGNVGWFAAKYLTDHGAKLIAVSDSKGVVHKNNGIDFETISKIKKEKGTVTEFKEGICEECESILDVKADILITAAIPDLIKAGDVDRLNFKLVVEGSNIPMTYAVEELLHTKGILVIPDFVANAGGVISSYVEYKGGDKNEMFKTVEEKIVANTDLVLKKATENKVPPRIVGMKIAQKRVRKKCKVCSV